MTQPKQHFVEYIQLGDAAERLNYRYIPIGDYLEIALRNARAKGPFRKLAFTFHPDGTRNAGDAAVLPGPEVWEVDAPVPAALLRPEMAFNSFLRATKEALLVALKLIRQEGQWHSDALDAAVQRMDQNSDLLECRLDYACATQKDAAVEVWFRLFADHIEIVARVTTPGGTAEHQLSATEPGAPTPYLANFFPVVSVQIVGRHVSVRGAGKRVLKEFPLP